MRISVPGTNVAGPHAPPFHGSLPPEGAELAWGGPARRSIAPTLHRCAGRCAPRGRGFTLLELLIVVAIMALATAGVSLALRDSVDTQLEREAQRLAALLESGRAQARMASTVVRWHTTPNGFVFEGVAPGVLPTRWLAGDVQVSSASMLVLGPEPVIGPQQVQLVSIAKPQHRVTLATDGVRPFAIVADSVPAAP